MCLSKFNGKIYFIINCRLKKMTVNHNEYQLDMVLNINSVQVSDFGVYTCKVYNSYGQGIAVQMIQGKNIELFQLKRRLLTKICPFEIWFKYTCNRLRQISNCISFVQQISMNAATTARSVAQPRVSTLWGSTGVSVNRATPSKTAPVQVKFYNSTNLSLENLILSCQRICKRKENRLE